MKFEATVLPFCAGTCCDSKVSSSCVVQPVGNYGMASELFYDYEKLLERIDLSGYG